MMYFANVTKIFKSIVSHVRLVVMRSNFQRRKQAVVYNVKRRQKDYITLY